MKRLIWKLTDSETPLGTFVLCVLFAAVCFMWFGCTTEDSGLGLASRTPAEVGVDLAPPPAPADGQSAPPPPADGPLPAPADATPPAPDVEPPPPDGPAGAFGTPYPACVTDIDVEEPVRGSCRYNLGRCRTPDGWVCVVCQTATPCARLSPDSTLTEGPRCAGRVSVCMSSCPVMGGDYCLRPRP